MDDLTIIKPRKFFVSIDFKEIYRYRELFVILALRDVKVRYKQTVFGGLWAIAQPLLTMIIFSFFFGNLAKMQSESVPYPIFSYSGLLLWTFFANSVNVASSSLINDTRLISKVYFPRLILPISTTLVCLVDYFVAGIILVGMMVYYKFPLLSSVIVIIPILIFTWILASGMGLFFSAVNIKYRDVKYVVPFFFQLLIFATPVIYPLSVSGRFRWLLWLNPMSGYIEAHRAALIGLHPIDWPMMGVSVLITIIIFITGLAYFKSVERYFADII
jgi:lipopolysaccharide transport system permease protein